MGYADFDPTEGTRLLEDLVRVTSFPATPREICHQGLSLLGKALGARGGIFLAGTARSGDPPTCTWGDPPEQELCSAALEHLRRADLEQDEAASDGVPVVVTSVLPGESGPLGVVALDRPAKWDPGARAFLSAAGRSLSAAWIAAQKLQLSHQQGELLARRNIELETLRELADAMQESGDQETMLQLALDLVLRKLALSSGWILLGDAARGRLELAAWRGIDERFPIRARREGIGSCLCQDVFESGKLQYARNTVDCPRLNELLGREGSLTHACVPLKFERGTLGVMNIASRPGQMFSSSELQFLEIVGHQLCLAVDKLRTARAETKRNAEASALVSLARAVGGSLDLEKVLAAVADYARELLAADRCAIFLGDLSKGLQFAHLSGAPIAGLTVGQPVDFESLGASAVLEALAGPGTLVIQNVPQDPRANATLGRQWGIGSEILIPLVAREGVQGLLMAGRAQASSWTPDEAAIADALAKHATVAIENARLYRQAQDALDRLQRAQYGMMRAERLAAVGTLASSLAHEVRNPLNSIHLQLVLLSRRVGSLEPVEQENLAPILEGARREIARLDELVQEFLSLSSIDRLALAEGDPAEVARDVVLLMAPVARLKGLAVLEEVQGQIPALRLDREKIKQVLINLFRNAMDATAEGGTIRVTTRADQGTVTLSVTDTGTGIEPGLDVFDFFTTTKRGGTGLGLPIARRIVEAHGGTLTFESAPGRGSTFSINLKVHTP